MKLGLKNSFGNFYLGAVVHHRIEVVRYSSGVDVFIIIIFLITFFNIIANYSNILVPVFPTMLMTEAQSVSDFMNGDTLLEEGEN